MLRMYFVQQWFNLADAACEDALLDSTALRVALAGVSSMCANGPNWAYLLPTDPNYSSFVAALLMAKANGNPVEVFTTYDGQYCHIGYIQLQ